MNSCIKKTSPEFRAVTLCTKFFLKTVSEQEVIDFFKENKNIKWDTFIRLTKYHRLAFIINFCMKEIPALFPKDTCDQVKTVHSINTKKMMILTGELHRLISLLQQNRIYPVCLKGPLLSEYLYGSYNSFRKSHDIDLLIEKNQILTADRILKSAGYIQHENGIEVSSMTPSELETYQNRIQHHSAYFNREKKIVTEIHWRLSKTESVNQDQSVHEKNFFNSNVKVLKQPDSLIHLLHHGSVHKWFRLFWLTDIARIITTRDINWEHALNRALQKDQIRPFVSGIILCSEIFSLSCPEPVRDFYKNNKKIMDKINSAALRQYESDMFMKRRRQSKISKIISGFLSDKLYLLRLKTETKNKLTIFFSGLYSQYDWYYVKLPERLFFLYIPLRPFIFIFKWYQRLVRGKYRVKNNS